MKDFLRRPSTVAFLLLTGFYAVCMAYVFWGAWGLDRAPVSPDMAVVFPVDHVARWFSALCAGGRFIPSDLMNVVGGMYVWQELQFALAGYLAALGAVYYLKGQRLPPVASYGGGAVFGLMGYCLTLFSAGHQGWFIWLMYGPFAFGLVDRFVRKGKLVNACALGAVLAWSSAQQPDIWFLFTVLTGTYGMWCVWGRRGASRVSWGRLAAGVALAGIVTLTTGAPQYGKALTQDWASRRNQIAESAGKSSADQAQPSQTTSEEQWLFCTSWSLPPEDTWEFLIPDLHGGSSDPRVSPTRPYRGRLGQQVVVPPGRGGLHPVTRKRVEPGERIWIPYRQHGLYMGVLTMLFALTGLVAVVRRKKEAADGLTDGPFWIGAAAVVYVCALGAFTPFYRLVFNLPFGNMIRCPVKFVHLLEWCLTVLAGYGLAWLWRRYGVRRRWMAVALAVAAAVNLLDLARVDRRYLAVEDVTFQRAPNDAAADVLARGGGTVYAALLPQEGQALVKTSLDLHGMKTAEKADEDVRFYLVSGTVLRQDPSYAQRLTRGDLTVAGYYALSPRTGVRHTSRNTAALMLLEAKNVPPPAPEQPPAPDRAAQGMTLLSVLMTIGTAGLLCYHKIFKINCRTQREREG